MNFVFVSLQRINTDRESTSIGLAKELSKDHRVLYINPPIDRKTYFSDNQDPYIKAHIEGIKNKNEKLEELTPNLWMLNPHIILESINWIPSDAVFSAFNWLNNKWFAKEIKSALTKLQFDNFILINDKDIFRSFYLKELLKPELYVYLDRDYTLGVDYWRKHGLKHEPKLMKKADTVVCNSFDFTKRAKLFNENSFYIGNGFDHELYNDNKTFLIPEDLKNIPRPIIGYVGALSALRLNVDMIAEIALLKSDWSFVLIGPEDEVFSKSIVHSISNVYYLGKKSKEVAPNYVKHFDVCINPQLINDITIGNFPLKVNEYLALGKPVVATTTNPMKDVFKDYVYLATNADGYIQQISKALKEDNSDLHSKRKKFIANFRWEKIGSVLLDCIEKTLTSKVS
jgi:glycosyltransferase involved in cell wall biosynthesis